MLTDVQVKWLLDKLAIACLVPGNAVLAGLGIVWIFGLLPQPGAIVLWFGGAALCILFSAVFYLLGLGYKGDRE